METLTGLNEAPTSSNSLINNPGVLSCYGNGWRQMRKYFLELLLIMVLSFLLSIPTLGLYIDELNDLLSKVVSFELFFFEFKGLAAYIFVAIVYMILIEWPIEYGVAYASLRATRNDQVEVKNIFAAFSNYLNAVLAYLLTTIIIIVGFFLLIIPGIIFLCKLAFVPYLIVDKKMDAVSAVKESWRLTKGHAVTIFLIGVFAFFLSIFGLVLVGVGLIFAIIWVELAIAWLYHTVSLSPAGRSISEVTV
jgi:uncharacterized membrane protein